MPRVNSRSGSPQSRRFRGGIHLVHDPHHDSADQQSAAHDVQTLQMLADHLGEQKGGDRGHHKSHDDEAQRVRQERAVAPGALRKSS